MPLFELWNIFLSQKSKSLRRSQRKNAEKDAFSSKAAIAYGSGQLHRISVRNYWKHNVSLVNMVAPNKCLNLVFGIFYRIV